MNAEQGRRQRGVMASDSEWERISQAAEAAGMELSRFIVKRSLMPDAVPPEVMRRFVREMLVISKLEERRLRGPVRPGTMPARPWMAGSNARACWRF